MYCLSSQESQTSSTISINDTSLERSIFYLYVTVTQIKITFILISIYLITMRVLKDTEEIYE